MKHIATLLLFIGFALGAWAQWAGEDVLVMKDVNLHDSPITLTVTNPSDKYCYIWTGPNIISDSHGPSITIQPIWPNVLSDDDLLRYVCKRISEDGVEEDEVLVVGVLEARIVSVVPLVECYNHGDPLSIDQFKIGTSPAGFESLVTLEDAEALNNSMFHDDKVTFAIQSPAYGTADATEHDWRNTYECEINVISSADNITGVPSLDLQKLLEKLQRGEAVTNKMKKITDKLKFLPCTPDFGISIIPGTVDYRTLCCDNQERSGAMINGLGVSVLGGFICDDIPTPIAAVKVIAGINLSGTLGPIVGMITFHGACQSVCIPIIIAINFQFGVKVEAIKGVLEASGAVRASPSVSFEWCPSEGIPNASLNLDLALPINVKAFSFFNYDITIPIFSGSIAL